MKRQDMPNVHMMKFLLIILAITSTKCSAFTSSLLSTSDGILSFTDQPRREGFSHKVIVPSTATTALCAKKENDDEGTKKMFNRLMQRSCMKQFLTQRSIQSFVYLLSECRDAKTADWIESFIETRGLLHFHGTGKFNTTKYPEWNSILLKLMDEPSTSVRTTVKERGTGSSRGVYNPLTGKRNKVNPYLNNEEKEVEIEIDIDPVSLASRIIAVREKIAHEWLEDLKLLSNVNNMILDYYDEAVMSDDDEDEDYDNISDLHSSFANIYGEFGMSSANSYDDILRNARGEVDSHDSLRKYIINSYPLFSDPASSPLRKSNFDLLFLLATQESVHRVLKSYKEDGGESKEANYRWLKDLYTKHVETYFDGPREFGFTEDFLEDILTTPPTIKALDINKISIIDTHAIAEDIVKTRARVAKDWRFMAMEVPEEHINLRKILFTAQMAKWGQRIMDDTSESTQAVEEGVMLEGGEFE